MTLGLGVLALLLVAGGSHVEGAQLSGHKSQAEIEKMTPEQRVEEYRKEFLRHSYSDDYEGLVGSQIERDGLKAVSYLVKIIDNYDPTQTAHNREKATGCYGAEGLLMQIDENTVRLRGSEAGRKGIDSMRRLAERMTAAHFDTSEADDYARQMRYKGTLSHLERMQGENGFDTAIKDSLELRYKIRMSSGELIGFVEFLIALDPTYPSWSKREWYKDWTDVNEHGVPQQYVIVKEIEPFNRLYLQYKAKGK